MRAPPIRRAITSAGSAERGASAKPPTAATFPPASRSIARSYKRALDRLGRRRRAGRSAVGDARRDRARIEGKSEAVIGEAAIGERPLRIPRSGSPLLNNSNSLDALDFAVNSSLQEAQSRKKFESISPYTGFRELPYVQSENPTSPPQQTSDLWLVITRTTQDYCNN